MQSKEKTADHWETLSGMMFHKMQYVCSVLSGFNQQFYPKYIISS
jgi:hypothetical protein